MRRYDKYEGHIHIAWSFDWKLDGYFMYVEDDRLEWKEGSSKEVDEICKKVAPDGGGWYIDLFTYRHGGFGYKVSEETMFTFMRRYRIDPTKIFD
ncbi:hypothetical protein BGX26_004408 [Mortierella sp. AD094]|nr:hypothetical protein BGX26_004408 [Mortierella sp. AD094]